MPIYYSLVILYLVEPRLIGYKISATMYPNSSNEPTLVVLAKY